MLWMVISVSLQLVTLYPKLAATVETVRADSTAAAERTDHLLRRSFPFCRRELLRQYFGARW